MNKIYFSLHLKIKIKAAKERIGTVISEKCFSYIPSRKVSGVLPIVKVPKRTWEESLLWKCPGKTLWHFAVVKLDSPHLLIWAKPLPATWQWQSRRERESRQAACIAVWSKFSTGDKKVCSDVLFLCQPPGETSHKYMHTICCCLLMIHSPRALWKRKCSRDSLSTQRKCGN